MEYVIGIDVGTQSLRTGIFDLKGNLIVSDSKSYPIYYPKPGWAEQNANDWWHSAKLTIKKALKKSRINPDCIIGISVDATSCTVIPVDNKGKPLRSAILWMDIRAYKEAAEITKTKDAVLQYVGWQESPEWMLPKALWLKKNEPEIYNKSYRIIECIDWFIFKLTGRWTVSMNNITCKWNYAKPSGGWPKKLIKKIGLSGIEEKFPKDILNIGEYIGTLTSGSAKELGLPEKISVAQGGIDAYTGAIGLNVVEPGRLALILGSSTCHIGLSSKPVYNTGVWGPYPEALIPKLWVLEGGQVSTGSIVKWFVENFVLEEKLKNRKNKTIEDIYISLDKKASKIIPGSEGLIVLDYWQGNRSPWRDPLARGTIWGFTLKHTSSHVLRAIYEGTAYGTKHILESMSKQGFKTREIYACGGGVKSSLWLQIHADVCQVPIYLTKINDAVMLGTAICAAVGAGKYKDIREAADKMVKITRKISPNIKNAKIYNKYFEYYVKTYIQLKELMHSLHKDEN